MIPNIYKGNYKLLAIPPLILILLSLFFIPQIKMGVDFKGGSLITLSLDNKIDAGTLESALLGEGFESKVRVYDTSVGVRAEIEVPQSAQIEKAEALKSSFNSKIGRVVELETASAASQELIDKKTEIKAIAQEMFNLAGTNQGDIESTNELVKKFNDAYGIVNSNYQKTLEAAIDKHVSYTSISIQTVSPVLTAHFIDRAFWVVVSSGILSVILVFLFFRDLIPGLAVLLGAVADIVIALGAMGLLGIPFTLNSFAALLMLIGFSLDTDILLTTRILKRKGDARENAFDAMKTGMTMSIMAIVAFGVLFALAVFTHIPTYFEIASVALAGLVGDIFATWGINGVIILHHAERRETK